MRPTSGASTPTRRPTASRETMRRQEDAQRPLHRSGRREPRPLRQHRQQQARLHRPHRDGRGDGQQAAEGDRLPRRGRRSRSPTPTAYKALCKELVREDPEACPPQSLKEMGTDSAMDLGMMIGDIPIANWSRGEDFELSNARLGGRPCPRRYLKRGLGLLRLPDRLPPGGRGARRPVQDRGRPRARVRDVLPRSARCSPTRTWPG